MAVDPPLARFRGRTHRLIASRWPTVGVFDDVASPEDARAALMLEAWTNDRVSFELERLSRMPDGDWLVGRPGATLVMAAFAYAPEGGGRFTSSALGAWYAGLDQATAIAETVFHHTKRLAHSQAGFRQTIQMRELVAPVSAELHDIRGRRRSRRDLYDPDDYSESQAFGERLRAAGSNGMVYDSVRHRDGRNAVVFRPRLLSQILEGDRFDYRWTGTPEPAVVRVTAVERRGGTRKSSARE